MSEEDELSHSGGGFGFFGRRSFDSVSEDELSDDSLRAEDFVQRSLFLTDDFGLVRIVVRLCLGEHFIGHFRLSLIHI